MFLYESLEKPRALQDTNWNKGLPVQSLVWRPTPFFLLWELPLLLISHYHRSAEAVPCAQRKERFLIQVCSELRVEVWSNATPLQRGTSDSNQVQKGERKNPSITGRKIYPGQFLNVWECRVVTELLGRSGSWHLVGLQVQAQGCSSVSVSLY